MGKAKDIYNRNWKPVAVVFGCFALWMLLNGCFMDKMNNLVENNITHWSEVWFAVIIVAAFLIWSSVLIVRHVKHDYLPSSEGKSIVLLLCLIYGYYRFLDGHFLFWGIGWFAWVDLSFVLLAEYVLCEIRGVIRAFRRTEYLADKEKFLLRDDALTNEEEDLFDYYAKARELAALLESIDLREHAFSVGIVGEWGVGKSTFLNLFANEQVKNGQIVVRFSPRSSNSVDKIAEDFFNVFANALTPYNGNCNTIISRYAYSLNIDNDRKWLNAVLSIFMKWTSGQQKKKVNDALWSIGKRVFVIVEDLDRLTAQEILEVLKLIDANGNFCNTIFLSAYDKKYVNMVLNKEIGYDGTDSFFTDKYFQYEYPMKRQQKSELQGYLLNELVMWAQTLCVDSSQIKAINQDLWEACRIILARLGTMRHLKRYINLFKVSYEKVWDKVNFLDFVIVTLIRYLDNDAYWALYGRRFLTYDGTYPTDESHYVLVKDYKQQLNQYNGIANLEQLVHRMFNEHSLRANNQYNCICRTESFENYFYDSTPGKLYYAEMTQLMNFSKLEEALKTLDAYCQKDRERNAKSIEEFLITRDANWIGTEERLLRYICLCISAATHYHNVKIMTCTWSFWLKSVYEEYQAFEAFGEVENYKNIVLDAYYQMVEYYPDWVGSRMLERIGYRDKNEDVDDRFVDTLADDIALAECAQKKYDSWHGTDKWNAIVSMQIAPISGKLNNDLTNNARAHITQMMTDYADEYAAAMIMIVPYSSSAPERGCRIKIEHYYETKSLIGNVEQFEKWMKKIKDKSLRYIVQSLHKEAMETNTAAKEIEFITPESYQNYALVADKVKRSTNK